jgi:hypothetical protein
VRLANVSLQWGANFVIFCHGFVEPDGSYTQRMTTAPRVELLRKRVKKKKGKAELRD